MSLDRTTLLREMGLAPHWRLRQAPAPAVEARAPAVKPAATPIVEPAPAPTFDRAAHIARLDWAALHTDIQRCTACPLHTTRNRAVPGSGDAAPALMIVGEGPGEQEDRSGEPFVGRAGQLLDAMLRAIGQQRPRQLYITNIVKCRPPGNRDPQPEEIAACAPYLARQIALARPRRLLALGKFAAQTLLQRPEATVAALRRDGGQHQGTPVHVTYHPSYLLRSPQEKSKAWEDLQRLQQALQRADPPGGDDAGNTTNTGESNG